jgi:predicted phosphoribosyltransferase
MESRSDDADDDTPHGWFFEDRRDAGTRLAAALSRYRGRDPLVLGIPRGGVPVAFEVATRLDGDLDVVVARKIGAPGQEELAIGAVAADGTRFVNAALRDMVGVSDVELAKLIESRQADARHGETRFRAGLQPLHPAGRIVIVVDDGLATGATMRAAVRSLARRGAEHVVVAVPVGAPESCHEIASEVDEFVCLAQPEPFYSVGQHYRIFDQTSDEEVERLLRASRERKRVGLNRPAPPA